MELDSSDKKAIVIATIRPRHDSGEILHRLCILKTDQRLARGRKWEIPSSDGIIVPEYFKYDGKYEQRYLIAGPSLSGKSTISATIIRSYLKQHPKNDVFLFSNVGADASIDRVKPTRIKIDENMVDDPIDVTELNNSICIFDDITSVGRPSILKSVQNLRNSVFAVGRHEHIDCISTNQILLNGHESVGTIKNSSIVILFPQEDAGSVENYLKRYRGFSKERIKDILDLDTRWLLITKYVPQFILYEHGLIFN
jgi:hypothetical protein